MMITLHAGEVDFAIANGDDRIHQVLSDESITMQQQTQVVVLTQDDAPTAFPEHAVRSLPLSYSVSYPPCATLAEALLQSRSVPAACPKGGVLVEQHGATQVTYAQAWVTSIRVERMGVSNRFIFSLVATRPDTAIPSPLALMDSRYVANLSALTGLTGGGATNLDGQVTADVAIGFTAFITPSLAGFAQAKHMRLIADPDPGVTVGNDDPAAGTLIVIPLDYDEETNAKIWTEV